MVNNKLSRNTIEISADHFSRTNSYLSNFFILSRNFHLATATMLAVTFSLLLSSCSRHSSQDPLERYFEVLSGLSNAEAESLDQLADLSDKWKTFEDSIFTSLESIHDSTREQALSKLSELEFNYLQKSFSYIDTWDCSYADLIVLQKNLSNKWLTSDHLSASHFFASLDSSAIEFSSLTKAERDYKAFLTKALKDSVYSHPKLLSFLKDEDYYFRNYLHLYTKHSSPVTAEIIRLTQEAICHISEHADDILLNGDQLNILLAYRTNRRFIQNSLRCIETIEKGEIGNESDAAAAILGLLAPFTSFSESLIDVRTEEQKESLTSIGERIPLEIEHIDKLGYQIICEPESIPSKLIKEYLVFYLNN